MKLPKIKLAQTVIKLCQLKEIQHIVISPGSRNAPLTIGFTNHEYFRCYSIVDERSAGFFALGIAQQIKKPVALVCTSGSALLNYYPAVAEAYYSNIPLVILSADRPKKLVGIGDGQTINQKNIYDNHIAYSANLEEGINDANEVEINSTLNIAISNSAPVHINIPFSEPLYDMIDAFTVNPSNVEIDKKEWFDLEKIPSMIKSWSQAKKKMILVGVNSPNQIDASILNKLSEDESVIVFTETTSNLHNEDFFPSIDKIIMPLEDKDYEELRPEILITFGGMIVSKKIKAFLRKWQPIEHWHVGEERANNTFFKLTEHIQTDPSSFFSLVLDQVDTKQSEYKTFWRNVKKHRAIKHSEYLISVPFSDLKVFEIVLSALPDEIILHLGNSSPIRYVQLFDVNPTARMYCNRGTSGIDGCTSTAIGAATAYDKQTVLITGDLGFFYDSNALWNNYIPKSFRIIVINNGGGGIFRILPGHKNTDNFDMYFETKHDLSAEELCKMYNFDYHKVVDEIELQNSINTFFNKSEKPQLLEVFTPRKINDEVLLSYFKHLK